VLKASGTVRTLYLALFSLAADVIFAQTPSAPKIETPDEAAQVEKALETNPDDVPARDRLLLYYSTRNPSHGCDPSRPEAPYPVADRTSSGTLGPQYIYRIDSTAAESSRRSRR